MNLPVLHIYSIFVCVAASSGVVFKAKKQKLHHWLLIVFKASVLPLWSVFLYNQKLLSWVEHQYSAIFKVGGLQKKLAEAFATFNLGSALEQPMLLEQTDIVN